MFNKNPTKVRIKCTNSVPLPFVRECKLQQSVTLKANTISGLMLVLVTRLELVRDFSHRILRSAEGDLSTDFVVDNFFGRNLQRLNNTGVGPKKHILNQSDIDCTRNKQKHHKCYWSVPMVCQQISGIFPFNFSSKRSRRNCG